MRGGRQPVWSGGAQPVAMNGPRSLSNLGLIDCAGGRAAHFPDPSRQIVMTILLKRSKNWSHSPTLLATITQIQQAPSHHDETQQTARQWIL